MLSHSSATRVLVAITRVDLRGSFNRLYSLVVEQLKADPLSGHLFVFTNGRRNRIKVLYWDGVVYGFAPRRTQHTAYIGTSRRVLYPHHPFYGQDLEVFGGAGGNRDIIYVRLPNKATRGIPAWMFDEGICGLIRASDRPIVDATALLKLAELLDRQLAHGVMQRDESIPSGAKPLATPLPSPTSSVLGRTTPEPHAAERGAREVPRSAQRTASRRRSQKRSAEGRGQ